MVISPEQSAKLKEEVQNRAKLTLKFIEEARIWMNEVGHKIAEQEDKISWVLACEKWAQPKPLALLEAAANGAAVEYYDDGFGGVRKKGWYRLFRTPFDQRYFLWSNPDEFRLITPDRKRFYDRCDSLELVRENRKYDGQSASRGCPQAPKEEDEWKRQGEEYKRQERYKERFS